MPKTGREIETELAGRDLRFSDLTGRTKIEILDQLPDCPPTRLQEIRRRFAVVQSLAILVALVAIIVEKQHLSVFPLVIVVLLTTSTLCLLKSFEANRSENKHFTSMVESARKEANEQAAHEEEKANEDVAMWDDLVQIAAEGRPPTSWAEGVIREGVFEPLERRSRHQALDELMLENRKRRLMEKLQERLAKKWSKEVQERREK